MPPEDDATTIGERIRIARKRRNMNQADLARRIGVSQPSVANWETGVHDPRRIVLSRIADVLETPVDWLAAGGRSAIERDTHAAAAYIRRYVRHVPIVSEQAAILLAENMNEDPHGYAEDYIPVTSNQTKLFAVFVDDELISSIAPKGSIAVIDYADRQPPDGEFCMALIEGRPFVRRWCSTPPRFETAAIRAEIESTPYSDQTPILGIVRVSIKVL